MTCSGGCCLNLPARGRARRRLSPRRKILRVIGKDLADSGDDGIMATCATEGVRIFCPAIMDSDWGIRIHLANEGGAE